MAAAQQSEPGSAGMAEASTAPVVERSGFAWSKPDAGTPEAEARYRTFPRKIAPTLVTAGAFLALIGGLGGWIRAVEVKNTTLGPQTVGTLWRYSEPTGRAVATLAAVALVVAAAWYFMDILPRFALQGAAAVLFAVMVARLITVNSRSSALAAAAKQNPNFLSFNAGFTWGAWL